MPAGAQARLGMLTRPKQPSSSAIFSTGRSSVGSRVLRAAWTACWKFFFETRPVLPGWPWDGAHAEPACASHVDARDGRCYCIDMAGASWLRVRAIPRPTRKKTRSEEHTSQLQSHLNLVCRLLL